MKNEIKKIDEEVRIVDVDDDIRVKSNDVKSYLDGVFTDILDNMEKHNYNVSDSMIQEGTVYIQFYSRNQIDCMMKEVYRFRYPDEVNSSGVVRETFWNFISTYCSFEISYDGFERDEDGGVPYGFVDLTFPVEELPKFKELFFEVFPKETSNSCCSQ